MSAPPEGLSAKNARLERELAELHRCVCPGHEEDSRALANFAVQVETLEAANARLRAVWELSEEFHGAVRAVLGEKYESVAFVDDAVAAMKRDLEAEVERLRESVADEYKRGWADAMGQVNVPEQPHEVQS